MRPAVVPDLEIIERHRTVWDSRPELRAVYEEWFLQLLHRVEGRDPVVEIGSGPGFLKERFPQVISTDVIPMPTLDVICGASSLPFQSGSLGAIVMLDVLHHLATPLAFLAEAGRVLRPGGRLVMIEPWITAPSYLLYRYFHHEDCLLSIDVRQPFAESEKRPFEGNAAIPFKVLKQAKAGTADLRVVQADPFIGLPYLATLGFKRHRPLPRFFIDLARLGERLLAPLRKLLATRILIVWERVGPDSAPLGR
jgi:SAM-dependent methyltransferase